MEWWVENRSPKRAFVFLNMTTTRLRTASGGPARVNLEAHLVEPGNSVYVQFPLEWHRPIPGALWAEVKPLPGDERFTVPLDVSAGPRPQVVVRTGAVADVHVGVMVEA